MNIKQFKLLLVAAEIALIVAVAVGSIYFSSLANAEYIKICNDPFQAADNYTLLSGRAVVVALSGVLATLFVGVAGKFRLNALRVGQPGFVAMSGIRVPSGSGKSSGGTSLALIAILAGATVGGVVILMDSNTADIQGNADTAPVSWGSADTASCIIESRTLSNGTVLYGCYNTTSASWVTSFTSSNKTFLTESVFDSLSSGTVALSEVAFDLALFNSILSGVQVVEQLNSSTRKFGNPADTNGPPYTIGVDAANAGYYYAEDNQYVTRWTSTVAETVANQAINATYDVDGGVVYTKTGTYTVTTDSIKVRSGVTFEGEGYANTLFYMANGANLPAVITNFNHVNGDSDIAVKNLKVDANKAGQTSYGRGVAFLEVNRGLVDGVWAQNGYEGSTEATRGVGIYFSHSHNCTVQNSFATGNGHEGIGARNASSNILITKNLSWDNVCEGYQVSTENGTLTNQGNFDISIIANTAINCTTGICVDSAAGSSYRTKIEGNTIIDCYGGIWDYQYNYGTVISGNTIQNTKTIAGWDSAYAAIGVRNGFGTLITGNYINASGKIAIRLYGTDSVAPQITNNEIWNSQEQAVTVEAVARPLISGNTFYISSLKTGHTYPTIWINGTSTYGAITNNQFLGSSVAYHIWFADATNVGWSIFGNSFVAIGGGDPAIVTNYSAPKVYNNVGFVTENSGSTANCVNGTWIATGLNGAVTNYALSVNGSAVINATASYLPPTIIAKNVTHAQIEFLFYDATLGYQPVTAIEQKQVDWDWQYKP
jgi:hypothetical protein